MNLSENKQIKTSYLIKKIYLQKIDQTKCMHDNIMSLYYTHVISGNTLKLSHVQENGMKVCLL